MHSRSSEALVLLLVLVLRILSVCLLAPKLSCSLSAPVAGLARACLCATQAIAVALIDKLILQAAALGAAVLFSVRCSKLHVNYVARKKEAKKTRCEKLRNS